MLSAVKIIHFFIDHSNVKAAIEYSDTVGILNNERIKIFEWNRKKK